MAARWAKKRDDSEPGIVAALRSLGCSVIKSDHPDLIVGFRGVTYLIECKTGPKARRTRSQVELFESWHGGPLSYISTPDEAIQLVTGEQRSGQRSEAR